MHAFSARSCGGNTASWRVIDRAAFSCVSSSNCRSMARNITAAWTQEGTTLLGGADGTTLQSMLGEFLEEAGSYSEELDCMNLIYYE